MANPMRSNLDNAFFSHDSKRMLTLVPSHLATAAQDDTVARYPLQFRYHDPPFESEETSFISDAIGIDIPSKAAPNVFENSPANRGLTNYNVTLGQSTHCPAPNPEGFPYSAYQAGTIFLGSQAYPVPSIEVSRPVNDNTPYNILNEQAQHHGMRGLNPSYCSSYAYNRSRSRSSSFVSMSDESQSRRTSSPPTSTSSSTLTTDREPRGNDGNLLTSPFSPLPGPSTTLRHSPEEWCVSTGMQELHNVSTDQVAFRVEGPSYREPKRRKARISNSDRRAICLYSSTHAGVTQEWMARQYKVERSTISKIIREKAKWLGSGPDSFGESPSRHRPSKFPEMEKLMVPWLEKMTQARRAITDSSIRSKAREIASSLHIGDSQFKASSGWVDNFKRRHNIRKGIYHGLHRAEIDEGKRYQEGGPTLGAPIGVSSSPGDETQLVPNELEPNQAENLTLPVVSIPPSDPGDELNLSRHSPCEPQLEEALARIMAWVDGMEPGQVATEDRDALRRLECKIKSGCR